MPLYLTLLGDVRLYEVLGEIDGDLSQRAKEQGCRCGGRLHRARYPRKPRGGPAGLGAGYQLRESYCCAEDGCRRRTTPASVRFLGRKVYVGTVVVLVSALRQGPTPTRVRKLQELFGVGERTLRRWRQWWQRIFAEGRFWKAARGRFMPAVAADELPRAVAERFGAHRSDGLCRLLRFLAPITTGSSVRSGGGI
jgi:hypothetical protein